MLFLFFTQSAMAKIPLSDALNHIEIVYSVTLNFQSKALKYK